MNQSIIPSPPSDTLQPPKDFREYSELATQLQQRGMAISSDDKTLYKLEQIGYYRLSGYSYPARKIQDRARIDVFMPDTHFDRIVELYVFDKRLRLLVADGLERIEIYIRSIIAHELGRQNPLAYCDKRHIRNAYKKSGAYDRWHRKLKKLLQDSQDDSIVWHRESSKSMPFWVIIEAWDFGQLQYYYKMLKQKFQEDVCNRLGIDNTNVLENWLKGLNILRNRCAHHGRTWNRALSTFAIPQECDYFKKLNLSAHSLSRVFGAIVIVWFFLRKMNPDSLWLDRIYDLIEGLPRVPGCPVTAMGVPEGGVPVDLMMG